MNILIEIDADDVEFGFVRPDGGGPCPHRPIYQSINQSTRPCNDDAAPPHAHTRTPQAAATWVKDHHKEEGTHSSALFRVRVCDDAQSSGSRFD